MTQTPNYGLEACNVHNDPDILYKKRIRLEIFFQLFSFLGSINPN